MTSPSTVCATRDTAARVRIAKNFATPARRGGERVCYGASEGSNLSRALRSRRAGSFTSDEVALLEYLAPHLQCAVRIHNRIAGLESGLNAATGVLDRFPAGVVAVNSDAKVILTNRAAAAILKRGDGLMSRDGLQAVSRQDTAKLRNAIASVCTQWDSGIRKPETLVRVYRPSGLKPFEVLVFPLPSHSSLRNGGAAAALLITDPEEGAALDSRALRQLFGLTLAQIRLCIAPGRGEERGGICATVRHQFEYSTQACKADLFEDWSETAE